MATFRKRNNKWNVQIRKSGCPILSETFTHKKDAKNWPIETEREIERGERPAFGTTQLDTLAALIERYGAEITSQKRGASFELSRLAKMQCHEIAKVSIRELSAVHLSQYRDERL